MGERKVLNKYIPADFDPSLVPRGKKLSSKDGTVPVRMMLPFSIQCSTCHTFLYRGTKFNSKKEPMGGPEGTYLGITRWRFYIKCTQCARPLTFLTDPAHADYEMESGGTRNYEMKRDPPAATPAEEQEAAEKEKLDPVQALENRVLDSQREMAEMDQLEEIRAMNARHLKLLHQHLNKAEQAHQGSGSTTHPNDNFQADIQAILQARDAAVALNQAPPNDTQEDDLVLTPEEEALIRSRPFGQKKRYPPINTQHDLTSHQDLLLRRLDDQDEILAEQKRQEQAAQLWPMQTVAPATEAQSTLPPRLPLVKTKRKRETPPATHPSDYNHKKSKPPGEVSAQEGPTPGGTEIDLASSSAPLTTEKGLDGLLGGYGSSSSDASA